MSTAKPPDVLLKNLTFKIDWLNRIKSSEKAYEEGNLDVLHIDIDYPTIKKSISDLESEATLSLLTTYKKHIEYLLSSEISIQKIIHSIFIVQDSTDFKNAQKLLLSDLDYLNRFIGSLIQDIKKSIPQEDYLSKTLKLDFFEDLVTFTDSLGENYIYTSGLKNSSEIARQIYDIYKENRLSTNHQVNFLGKKKEIYYLLYKVAETNTLLDRKAFFENKLFFHTRENIKYANLRKAVSDFIKKEPIEKSFIDKYLSDYLN